MASRIKVVFPPGIEDYEWEVTAKGWLPAVVVEIDERRYTFTVYDRARLLQDIDDALGTDDTLVVPNLLVVTTVTQDRIEAAVRGLVRSGRLKDLRPDES
jgi:phosphopantetheine adenylyltransferase